MGQSVKNHVKEDEVMVYKTSGVCASSIDIQVDEKEGRKFIRSVRFLGGCNGNAQGISKLIEGMELNEVIKRLDGVRCGSRNTSCPDQLAKILKNL